jgi:hypothetical protein
LVALEDLLPMEEEMFNPMLVDLTIELFRLKKTNLSLVALTSMMQHALSISGLQAKKVMKHLQSMGY